MSYLQEKSCGHKL